MPIIQLAGRDPWGQLLHDDLTKREEAEKDIFSKKEEMQKKTLEESINRAYN